MTIPFDPKEGLILVPARLFGPAGDSVVRLALDTAATGSLLNWDIAVFLGYDPASVRGRVQLTSVSGVEFAPRIMLERLEAIEIVRHSFPIVCHTLPPTAAIDGLLGLDFFRGKRLIIDLRAGHVSVDRT